jgi:hypothetical protein
MKEDLIILLKNFYLIFKILKISFYEVQNPPNYAVYRSNKTQSAVQDNLSLTSLVPTGTVLQFIMRWFSCFKN